MALAEAATHSSCPAPRGTRARCADGGGEDMAKPVVIAAVAGAVAGAAAAWQTQHVQEEQEGLLARAAVSVEAARQTALAAFPGAAIVESEIEEEGGRLIYSFELRGQ